MLYTEDYFEQMQKDKLAGRPTDPSFAAVGPAWKSLSAAQKKVYDDRAAVLKSKVAAEVAEYHAKYTPLQLAARKQIDLAKSAAKAETSLAREVRIAGGDPARVKRPPTGYQLFVRETAKSHKGAKIGEISSAASAAWKELTEAEKAAWAARAETEVLKAAKF
ncbi:hypothetical protein BC828DRAFT_373872 [Blastocladiella britannica]|nr:hypothetical protein BC828DRAFT_373872 [Blastocladiella britannica]